MYKRQTQQAEVGGKGGTNRDRQADGQTDRQTHRQMDSQREREREKGRREGVGDCSRNIQNLFAFHHQQYKINCNST